MSPARERAKVSLTVDEGVLRGMKQDAKRAGRTLSVDGSDTGDRGGVLALK
jgi:hypothetical protein